MFNGNVFLALRLDGLCSKVYSCAWKAARTSGLSPESRRKEARDKRLKFAMALEKFDIPTSWWG